MQAPNSSTKSVVKKKSFLNLSLFQLDPTEVFFFFLNIFYLHHRLLNLFVEFSIPIPHPLLERCIMNKEKRYSWKVSFPNRDSFEIAHTEDARPINRPHRRVNVRIESASIFPIYPHGARSPYVGPSLSRLMHARNLSFCHRACSDESAARASSGNRRRDLAGYRSPMMNAGLWRTEISIS